MTIHERLKGRNIGIIGMARSGMAAARLVHRVGGVPFVSDIKPADQLTTSISDLKTLGVDFEAGGHTKRLLDSEFVILSPGIPRDAEIVGKVVEAGIPIFSEIELASWFCRGRIIAITGSNGKTTTASLTGAILSAAGVDNIVCGNIGYPFSDAVLDIPADGYAVVEVSNFQLELIEEFSPHIAMILNITPDHLDRYRDFDAYKETKYRITENQQSSDYLILNADNAAIDGNSIGTEAQKVYFATSRLLPAGVSRRGETLVGLVRGNECHVIDIDQIRIPGPHNLQNAAAAALAALLLDIEPEFIKMALRRFPGVEHRLEEVEVIAGVRFINDSKATNVDSVCYALKSFDMPICLIAGGRDKGSDFEPIIECGRNKIREMILIGEAQKKMFDALGESFPVQLAGSMEEAVSKAFIGASPGEVVLLSPACASFDMYDDFEHRGKEFKKAVLTLKNSNHIAKGTETK